LEIVGAGLDGVGERILLRVTGARCQNRRALARGGRMRARRRGVRVDEGGSGGKVADRPAGSHAMPARNVRRE
jgi:hypothetical protein